MNTLQYIHWLNNPYQLAAEDSESLKKIIDEFPYFQSARALYLKTLNQQRSFLYNNELKKTAAYTTDRDVLFDFIISEEFITYKPLQIEDVEVFDEDYLEIKKTEPTLDETIEKRVLDTLVYIENPTKETELIHKIDQITKSKLEAKIEREGLQQLEEKLEVGTPLDFSSNDKFSFTEWLKLTSAQPIDRSEADINEIFEEKEQNVSEEVTDEKQKKFALISKFIETNPKIISSKTAVIPSINLDRNEDDQPFYMTETLARIYLEQKKYQKAIQAYDILILKYPEKSSLFANRIADIKKLQEFNNI
ncbi:MAG TPA: tetratricopeptide repeat protein [Flavobacterium sp.]|nr:tetratricopeptide repeat protein [Flavobacterium sp.]